MANISCFETHNESPFGLAFVLLMTMDECKSHALSRSDWSDGASENAMEKEERFNLCSIMVCSVSFKLALGQHGIS